MMREYEPSYNRRETRRTKIWWEEGSRVGAEEKILLLLESLSLKKKNPPFNFLVYEPLNPLFCL